MKLTKEELRALYENNRAVEAAASLGVSVGTYFRYLKAAKIPRKKRTGPKPKVEIVG